MPVLNGSLPVWVKAAGTIGLPGIIALYLIYQVTTSVPLALQRHDAHTIRDAHAIINLLQLVCANTAQDGSTRASCFHSGEGQ